MALRLTQFLAIILTALALVPSGAHLAALPKKWKSALRLAAVCQSTKRRNGLHKHGSMCGGIHTSS